MDRHWLLGGGIGSGKSEVRRLLAEAGVATIDADSVGHQVIDPDGPAFSAVAAEWPEVVVDGAIDRPALGAVVFADAAELARLERITHPHIFGTIRALVEEIDGVAVVEIPILKPALGGGWKTIVVDAPDETRLERAVSRGLDREDVLRRMRSQPSRAEWLAVGDLVIPNQGNREELAGAVSQVVERLRTISLR